jgi:flavin reductase (DIM6/NTAB) family NADH-FMN oxidoreductase RutF
MKIRESDLSKGIWALPSFPVVLVTVGHNIMTAGAFHFYSFNPPSVMIGIKPNRYTYKLINECNEFGINLPRSDQIDLVRICGSVSGRDDVDKYLKARVTAMKGYKIESWLIEECPVNIECKVVHKINYPGTHKWYVGEIIAVHIDEEYKREESLMFWSDEYRKVGEYLE